MPRSIDQARNLGPVTAAELMEIGIATCEDLRALGWEEAYLRWVQAYPKRLHLTAARALAGALVDEDWRRLPTVLDAEVRAVVRMLRSQ